MKGIVQDFFRRGFVALGFGPIVLAVLYLIIQRVSSIDTLSVNQVCLGIFSLSALAFIAGGMNVVYQIERLPLMLAIFIHGIVLYVSYLAVFLMNGWLEQGIEPFLIFSCIFVIGYLAIWVFIYYFTRRKTARLNEMLRKKQDNIDIT